MSQIRSMSATSDDLAFESGVPVLQNDLLKPKWTTSFQEILGMTEDSMRVTQTQALFKSAFSDSGDVNILQLQTLARSLYYWPKNLTGQFLKGNFDRSPTTCMLKDKILLSMIAFCYQSNSENKVALKK